MSIWNYSELYNLIKSEYQLTLGEGNTPVFPIEIDDCVVRFKDETKNPNESFKDRSLAYQLSYYYSKGKKNFVISSSGNSARSALAYTSLMPDAKLTVFVSGKIPPYKFEKLRNQDLSFEQTNNSEIQISKVPKSDAIKFARKTSAINLRGSVDENAVVGFKTLGYEIMEQLPQCDALFICCSSGTSTKGIFLAMQEKLQTQNSLPEAHALLSDRDQLLAEKFKIPAINIVQTTYIHPIAEELDSVFLESESSIANAVSDRVAHRRKDVLQILKETEGSGWVVSDDEIRKAKEILENKGLKIEGYNAFVSFAGYLKAIKKGYKYQNPICILSGI